ncbi:MAG: iron uptake transporter permease EfeU [Acidimicrobiia bacterium]
MLQTFLIMLREGLEAALVVGILVGYLVRTDKRTLLPQVWIGVATAAALSLAAGFLLTIVFEGLDTFRLQEAFGGTMSIVAVSFVTWMIFWMRRQSHLLKGEITGQLDRAVTFGSVAVVGCAFLAVGREGLESALFLWPLFREAGSGIAPSIGAVLGLGVAIACGWLFYRGAVRLNLSTFFRVTGAALIVVAAGVLAYGIHDLQEASVLPGLHSIAFDVSEQMPASSWYGSIVKGIFNVSPQMTWLELAAYFLYLVPTMFLFARPVRRVADHGVPARAPATV